MTLHDRLKPIEEVGEQSATRGWQSVVFGVVLAVFAAGFAAAMPFTLRVTDRAGDRSPQAERALTSPSVDPAAVSLPSPAFSTRPSEIAPTPSPATELGEATTVARVPANPPVRREPARREDDDATDDQSLDDEDLDDPDDDDNEHSKEPRSADKSGGSKDDSKHADDSPHDRDDSRDRSRDDRSHKDKGKDRPIAGDGAFYLVGLS